MPPQDENFRPGPPQLPATPAPHEVTTPDVADITSSVAPPKTGGSLVELVRQSRRNGISWVMMSLGLGTALVYNVHVPEDPSADRILVAAGVIIIFAGFSCRWRADIGTAVAFAALAVGYLFAYIVDNRILPLILCFGCGSAVVSGAALITAFALEMTARNAAQPRVADVAVPFPREPRSQPPIVYRPPFPKSEAITAEPPAPQFPFPPAPPPPDIVDATIVERPPLSKWVILAAIVFPTSLTGLYAGQWQWAIFAGPICATIAAIFGFRWFFPRVYVLTGDAIESIRPRRTIPYADMRWVLAGDHEPHDRFSIYVITADRSLIIGPSLTCDSQSLLAALQRRVPRRAREAHLPASLESFRAQQLRLHAREQVHIFHALPSIPATTAVVVSLKLAAALVLAIPLWVGIGFSMPGDPDMWVCGAAAMSSVVLAVMFVLVAGFLYATRAGVARRFRGACLIITPDGLAIQQQHLHGEMRWSEILGGRFRFPPRYGDESAIELDVGGTEIRIADAYDAPPQIIAKLIEAYSGLRLRR